MFPKLARQIFWEGGVGDEGGTITKLLNSPQILPEGPVPDPLYSMKILVGKLNDKLDYYTTNPMLV